MADLRGLIERVADGRIRALSIKQPYPHHIFHDGKDVENRDWPTRGRGWFLVHAGKKDDEDRELIREKNMPLGGIVGAARIVDCVTEMDSPWFFGDYGFVLKDALPLPLVPCKGQLGFFSLERPVLDAVSALISETANTRAIDSRGEV
jgi:hypothetical protein